MRYDARTRRSIVTLAGVSALVLAFAGEAAAASGTGGGFAPVDRPGPALSIPRAELERSLRCTPSVATATRPPVLMVHGTALDSATDFDWNWLRALDKLGWPYCTVELKGSGMADIQGSAERVVFAIRRMHERSGRQVQVVGHSQGGMIGRWALRFWPDTRPLVDDLVGLAPSNHGTLDADGICALPCAPSFWQQRSRANFTRALNSGQETFAGISYTSIYSRYDQIVVPNGTESGSSALRTGDGDRTNVALQQVCPLNLAEHLATGTYDPVAYALAIDALRHPGPARPARVGRAVCSRLFQPGVDPSRFAANEARLVAYIGQQVALYPRARAEPPLRCYVLRDCEAPPPACAPRRRGVNGRRLGPFSLGERRATLRRRARRLRSRETVDRYCLEGNGDVLRAGFPSQRLRRRFGPRTRRRVKGRAVFLLTTSPAYSVKGIRAGMGTAELRRALGGRGHFRRVSSGRAVFYLARGRSSTLFFKARRRRVLEVGIADRVLSRGRRGARRFAFAFAR